MNIEVVRRMLEEAFAIDECRKSAESLWCDMHRAGITIPPSEEVIKALAGLRGNTYSTFDPECVELVIYSNMVSGLTFLAYVALAKERL